MSDPTERIAKLEEVLASLTYSTPCNCEGIWKQCDRCKAEEVLEEKDDG